MPLTKTLVMFALSLSAWSVCLHGQSLSRGKDFVIDENKPFVYVRFDHVGTGEQRSEDESSSRIWLRVVNNCRFPIVLRTTGVPDESPKEEVGIMYEVVANPVAQGMVILSPEPTKGQSTTRAGNEHEKPLARPESTEMPKGTMFHVGSAQVLPPSKNILFSIPVNHLGKKWHIEIPFTFDLPAGKGPHDPNAGGEPILVIEYSMWDLPLKLRTEIQK